MGGCLPMVAQVPIFYALYLALSVSVELQNAPFLCFGRLFGVDLWICDLAAHDPTYVLPVLMGVTMFVQQKMTPTMGDPRQAKMMLFMPVIFTFMFLNLPVGPRPVLDRVQRAADPAAEAHGPTGALARDARGQGRQPGLSARAPTTRSSPSRPRSVRAPSG